MAASSAARLLFGDALPYPSFSPEPLRPDADARADVDHGPVARADLRALALGIYRPDEHPLRSWRRSFRLFPSPPSRPRICFVGQSPAQLPTYLRRAGLPNTPAASKGARLRALIALLVRLGAWLATRRSNPRNSQPAPGQPPPSSVQGPSGRRAELLSTRLRVHLQESGLGPLTPPPGASLHPPSNFPDIGALSCSALGPATPTDRAERAQLACGGEAGARTEHPWELSLFCDVGLVVYALADVARRAALVLSMAHLATLPALADPLPEDFPFRLAGPLRPREAYSALAAFGALPALASTLPSRLHPRDDGHSLAMFPQPLHRWHWVSGGTANSTPCSPQSSSSKARTSIGIGPSTLEAHNAGIMPIIASKCHLPCA